MFCGSNVANVTNFFNGAKSFFGEGDFDYILPILIKIARIGRI